MTDRMPHYKGIARPLKPRPSSILARQGEKYAEIAHCHLTLRPNSPSRSIADAAGAPVGEPPQAMMAEGSYLEGLWWSRRAGNISRSRPPASILLLCNHPSTYSSSLQLPSKFNTRLLLYNASTRHVQPLSNPASPLLSSLCYSSSSSRPYVLPTKVLSMCMLPQTSIASSSTAHFPSFPNAEIGP